MGKWVLLVVESKGHLWEKQDQKVSEPWCRQIVFWFELFPDDHPHFLRYATELAGVLRDTIFVDQVGLEF